MYKSGIKYIISDFVILNKAQIIQISGKHYENCPCP